jgi:hypothetical protein
MAQCSAVLFSAVGGSFNNYVDKERKVVRRKFMHNHTNKG